MLQEKEPELPGTRDVAIEFTAKEMALACLREARAESSAVAISFLDEKTLVGERDAMKTAVKVARRLGAQFTLIGVVAVGDLPAEEAGRIREKGALKGESVRTSDGRRKALADIQARIRERGYHLK